MSGTASRARRALAATAEVPMSVGGALGAARRRPGETRLTSNRWGDQSPAWSADGRLIPFSSNRSGNDDLYVMPHGRSPVRRPTDHPFGTPAPARRRSALGSSSSATAMTRRSCVARRDPATGRTGIAVVDTLGSAARLLTSNPQPGFWDLRPTWSADGAWITFQREFDKGRFEMELFRVRPDRTGLARVTRNEVWDAKPSGSHFGPALAFTSEQHGGLENLYVLSPQGQTRITASEVPDHQPDWGRASRPAASAWTPTAATRTGTASARRSPRTGGRSPSTRPRRTSFPTTRTVGSRRCSCGTCTPRRTVGSSWSTRRPTTTVPGDVNGATDVFVRDLAARTTSLVSLAHDRTQGRRSSFEGALSEFAGFAVFLSESGDLVPDDANRIVDVSVRGPFGP